MDKAKSLFSSYRAGPYLRVGVVLCVVRKVCATATKSIQFQAHTFSKHAIHIQSNKLVGRAIQSIPFTRKSCVLWAFCRKNMEAPSLALTAVQPYQLCTLSHCEMVSSSNRRHPVTPSFWTGDRMLVCLLLIYQHVRRNHCLVSSAAYCAINGIWIAGIRQSGATCAEFQLYPSGNACSKSCWNSKCISQVLITKVRYQLWQWF